MAVTTLYYIYLCSTKTWIRILSLGLLYGYKCVLQIFALYLAFQTRKVKIKGLNDAKYITTMVYVVTLVIIVTLVSTFALTNYVNVYAVVYCVGLAISGSLILGLTFIPKVSFHLALLCDSYGIAELFQSDYCLIQRLRFPLRHFFASIVQISHSKLCSYFVTY